MAQVHGGGAADAVEQSGGLLLPNASEGEHAALAEEVEYADAARLAPVLVVGSEGHVTAVKALDHRSAVSAREGHVSGLHGFLRRGRRGGHHDGHAAEAQEHDRAVRSGHRPELPVG
jgi:hypothetical protein